MLKRYREGQILNEKCLKWIWIVVQQQKLCAGKLWILCWSLCIGLSEKLAFEFSSLGRVVLCRGVRYKIVLDEWSPSIPTKHTHTHNGHNKACPLLFTTDRTRGSFLLGIASRKGCFYHQNECILCCIFLRDDVMMVSCRAHNVKVAYCSSLQPLGFMNNNS